MNKKLSLLSWFVLYMILAISIHAQTPANSKQMTLYQSSHYEVDANSNLPPGDVERVVYLLEANYTLFSEMFTTIDHRPQNLLNVEFLGTKADFDETLAQMKVYNRHNFIYMYYANPQENTLITYPIEDDKEQIAQLSRHSFFSYIFDSIPTLPTWLREGMALYYASVIYNENDQGLVPYNRLYLDDLKRVAKGSNLPLQELMMMSDAPGSFENAQFERNLLFAWGIINYLMFSENESHPTLIQSAIALASKDKTQAENSQLILDHILAQYPGIQGDFETFLGQQMGYIETLNALRESYTKKDYPQAKEYAESANVMKQDAYLPVYYLGLIAFENKEYEEAQKHYQQSLSMGAPEALIDFAMGHILYYGQKDYAQASATFEQAKQKDPTKYGARVDAILKNLAKDSDSAYRLPITASSPNTQANTQESTPNP
ncbi:MAG: tetratricopeptide repeat protein [Spirochaetia bacterium]